MNACVQKLENGDMSKIIKDNSNHLYDEAKKIIEEGRQKALTAVNSLMLIANWHIGQLIVKSQGGKDKSAYGNKLITQLAQQMENEFGRGYSKRNLHYMRAFYMAFPNFDALPLQLSWSVCLQLMKETNDNARLYYTSEAIKNSWSSRITERMIRSGSFYRYLENKPAILPNKATLEYESQTPKQSIKDPYYLEFLGLPENNEVSENELEGLLVTHLKTFIMELGRGFTFVERQKRITLDQESFYVDLVFYNIQLDCYVLIDLKTKKLRSQDIGQMQMYVNYFDREIKTERQKPTIGLVLCESKNNAQVSYMLPVDNGQIFAAAYKVILPSEEELKEIIIRSSARLK